MADEYPTNPTKPKKRYLTDEEVIEVARGLHTRKYFISAVLDEEEMNRMLPLIFMPLALMDEDTWKKFEEDEAYVFYEEVSKALPRSIDGYPIFGSMRAMTMADYALVCSAAKQIDQALNVKIVLPTTEQKIEPSPGDKSSDRR